MTTGEQIKFFRKQKHFSQKELGELLGVSAAMIGQYETGKRNPKFETLEKIANALGVPVWRLTDIESNKKVEELQSLINEIIIESNETDKAIKKTFANISASLSLNQPSIVDSTVSAATNALSSMVKATDTLLKQIDYNDLEAFANYIANWGFWLEGQDGKYYLATKKERVEISEDELLNLIRSARASVRGLLNDILDRKQSPATENPIDKKE